MNKKLTIVWGSYSYTRSSTSCLLPNQNPKRPGKVRVSPPCMPRSACVLRSALTQDLIFFVQGPGRCEAVTPSCMPRSACVYERRFRVWTFGVMVWSLVNNNLTVVWGVTLPELLSYTTVNLLFTELQTRTPHVPGRGEAVTPPCMPRSACVCVER